MNAASARRTVVFNNPIIDSPTEPENKTDGMYWHNPETGALYVYSEGGEGDGSGWSKVADYNESNALITEIQEGTIKNPQFQTLVDNAAALQAIAGQRDFLGTLAESVGLTPEGFNVYSINKEFVARVAPQELLLLKKIGEALEMAASFGLLKAVTAPLLQIGQEGAVNPTLKFGESGGWVLEVNSQTGNLTCRKG